MDRERSSMTTRRRLIGAAAGLSGAMALSAIDPAKASAAETSTAAGVSAAQIRTSVRGPIGLELSGSVEAFLRSADGGDTIGKVATFQSGNEPFPRKHIAGIKYDPFEFVSTTFNIGQSYAQWIVDMPNLQASRRDGAVVTADFNYVAKSRREFTDALISAITLPTLDASSKEAGRFTVTVVPESASDGSPKGTLSKALQAGPAKTWSTANFRLEIDGLDCSRVNKIESITISQSIVEQRLGETRDIAIVPGDVDFPNLVVTFAASTISSWQKWFNSFVVNGKNSDSDEKNGRIIYLAADLQTELAVLQLHHIGIFRLDPDQEPEDSSTGAPNAVQRATAELYVEQMNFTKFGPYVLT